jgi:hypothetical protein
MTQRGWCWIGIAVMAAVSAGCADGGTGRAADLGTTIPAASVTESPSTSGPVSETPTLIPLPAGATLTFTPANPTAGQETTLTATGCPLGDRIVFVFYASDGSSFVPSNPSDTSLEATSVSSMTATTYRFRFPDVARQLDGTSF